MGQHLVLGHQGGRRVLVDHHPRVDPRRRRQERRQPAVEPRVDEQRGPPLADRAELGERDLGEVEREGDRLAVEVAAADHPAAAGRDRVDVGDPAAREDERVVGRRVELDVEDAAQVVERVADRAVDLRHAAQRVRVLDLVGVAVMAGLQRRCRAAGGAAPRRRRSGPGAAGPAGRPRRTPRPCRAAPRRSSPRRRSRSGPGGPRRPARARRARPSSASR